MSWQKNKYMRTFGVTHSTLSGRLKSKLIYEFFKLRDGIQCYRCGEPVRCGDHSLDHAESFWDSEDPWEAFFNIDKCFMSHQRCNYKDGSVQRARVKKRKQLRRDLVRGIYGTASADRDSRSFKRDLRKTKLPKEDSEKEP